MNEVRFVISDGNLGFAPVSDDSTSAIVYYKPADVELPEDWGSGSVKEVFSVGDAVALGITADDAEFGLLHYQVSEFYRLQPAAMLYLMVVDAPESTWNFQDLRVLQQAANGEVKQVFVFAPRKAWNVADVTALQTEVDYLSGLGADAGIFRPLFVFYGCNMRSVTLSGLANLRGGSYSAEAVAVVIGQDAGGAGASYYDADNTVSVPCGGALLGALSRGNVAHSLAWVERNNLSNGVELEVLGFANGQLYTAQSYTLLSQLHARGYLFMRKIDGLAGSYPVDSLNATDETSDYNSIEHVRVVQKACRQVRLAMLPRLSSPVTLAAGGKVDPRDASALESLAGVRLSAMQSNGEVSSATVRVDTENNVITSRKVRVVIRVRPVGVMREIEVNLSLSVA